MCKIYKFLYTAFLFGILFINITYSQDFKKTMAFEYGTTFKMPKGFNLKNNNDTPYLQYLYTNKSFLRVPILPDFYLDNRDSSIRILVCSFNVNDQQPDLFNPYYVDPNKVAFYHTVTPSDTSILPIEFKSTKALIKTNSDFIAEFIYDFGNSNTLGEYKYNKCLLFNKYNQVFLQVIYLFKESSIHEMTKIINETKHMFQFENKPTLQPKSIDNILKKHYAEYETAILYDTLDNPWNRGKIYKNHYYFWEENFAFKFRSALISVEFPKNSLWPYYNEINYKIIDTTINRDKWRIANEDFRKYLTLAKNIPNRCSLDEMEKLNADEGYIFDFSHDRDDEYRNKYKDCKVLLIHKRNVGSMIIKYYYHSKDKDKIDEIVKLSLGNIRFKDQEFFEKLGNKVYPY